jgi:hypothetical protein
MTVTEELLKWVKWVENILRRINNERNSRLSAEESMREDIRAIKHVLYAMDKRGRLTLPEAMEKLMERGI